MENFTRKYEYLADVHYWYLHGYFAYDYKISVSVPATTALLAYISN